ncbi:MAG: glycosyltransferase [Pseudonocardiales bacterium]|nr:glycosyltransferase [Pseudonocardiales bacterium]MBV9650370.1 glycosyltransferase [Pseudonocardiales bacterium]HZS21988.1 glycosyltransferase [Pseudonocardiaceae bacterium]
MRVLHVITGLGVGGAELQLRSILQHTRHQSDVVTLYNPGPVADMIVGDGGRVRDLGMTSNTELPALGRLTRLIRAGRYDVVHTHLYRSCVYGRIAARLAGTPVVVTTEHSIGETHLERRRMTLGVRALYLGTDLCSDATIAVSDAVAHRLTKWGVPARKIETIPNGLDFDRVAFDATARDTIRAEFDLPRDAFVVGVLGRLDPIKRFDLVIRAAAPLLDDQHRLLIVGDGQIRPDLEAEAARQGVAELVTFAGERHDVAAMLSSLDLFIAASEQETFGLSVLEALANGIPALYTTCPALEGIETDRARQIPGEVEEMRREIAAEIAQGRRPRQGVPAIREQYGIEAVTRRIDDLYERLMAARSRARHNGRVLANPVGGN